MANTGNPQNSNQRLARLEGPAGATRDKLQAFLRENGWLVETKVHKNTYRLTLSGPPGCGKTGAIDALLNGRRIGQVISRTTPTINGSNAERIVFKAA